MDGMRGSQFSILTDSCLPHQSLMASQGAWLELRRTGWFWKVKAVEIPQSWTVLLDSWAFEKSFFQGAPLLFKRKEAYCSTEQRNYRNPATQLHRPIQSIQVQTDLAEDPALPDTNSVMSWKGRCPLLLQAWLCQALNTVEGFPCVCVEGKRFYTRKKESGHVGITVLKAEEPSGYKLGSRTRLPGVIPTSVSYWVNLSMSISFLSFGSLSCRRKVNSIP